MIVRVLLIGILALGFISEGAEQEPDTLTRFHRFSDLRVIHRYSPESEVVAVNLYLLGGVRQITPDIAGIEPLLLRASQHGTLNYPGNAARGVLSDLGSWVLVTAEDDWTLFGFRGLAHAFDSTWSVFADRLVHPTLDSASVEMERAKMLASAKVRLVDPDAVVRDLVRTNALASHPYGLEVRGTVESLSSLRLADLGAYHSDQTLKSRMLLVVVGGVSAQQVEAAIARTLGELPNGDYVWKMPPRWSGVAPTVVTAFQAIPTDYILGYFGGPSANSEQAPAFRLAVTALSGMIASRARDRGLTYAGGAIFFDRAVTGGGIYFSTDLAEDCIRVANDAIELLQDAVYRRSDLRDYARSSIHEYYLDNETSWQQANFLGRTFLYRAVLPSPQEHVDALLEVSPDEVRRAARDYFKNIQYALVGDTAHVPRREMTRR